MNTVARIGVIGGTAVNNDVILPLLENLGLEIIQKDEVLFETPWGVVPLLSLVVEIDQESHTLFVLARHHALNGKSTPPHNIEFRANIHALNGCNLNSLFVMNNVGSLVNDWPPGSVGVVEDIVGIGGKGWTYSDEEAHHVDVSLTLDPLLREIVAAAYSKFQSSQTRLSHVYFQSMGPQFETPAENRSFRFLGASCVGMTFVPEVLLAAELGIPMCAVVVAGNWAAGIGKNDEQVSSETGRTYGGVGKADSESGAVSDKSSSPLIGKDVIAAAQGYSEPLWIGLIALLRHFSKSS